MFPAAPANTRPRNLSSHSALSSCGLFAPLTFWQFFVSLRPLVQALGSCSASGAPWSSAMLPPFGRGRVTTTISRHTSHVNVFPLLASGIDLKITNSSVNDFWKSCDVAQNGADHQTKKDKVITSFSVTLKKSQRMTLG